MGKKNITLLFLSLLPAALVAFFALNLPAAAQPDSGASATVVVNSLLDESDGSCSDGDCSLRDAVAVASPGSTIGFSVTGVITLTLDQITLDKNVTIDGPGASLLAISGNDALRVFQVASGVKATIDGLTIRDGYVSSGLPGRETGGGINNQGTLTVTHSVIADNLGFSSHGGGISNYATLIVYTSVITGNRAGYGSGGIYNDIDCILIVGSGTSFINNSTSGGAGGAIGNSGVLTVSDSDFIGNHAGTYGGGIDNYPNATLKVDECNFTENTAAWRGGGVDTWTGGTLEVTKSRFTGNVASGSYPDGRGGGIYNTLPGRIEDSTFIDNSANEFGGGVFNNGVISFTGNTFSGNTSNKRGGGLANQDFPITIANSTFTGNSAVDSGGGIEDTAVGSTLVNVTLAANSAPAGANLMSYDNRMTLKNTLIANPSSGPNCGETVKDGGGNLRWPASDSTCVGQYGDPALEPLADNSGPTQTMALPPNSAAIDIGNNAACAAAPVNNLDQRGVTRPLDGDGDGHAVCDAGAFEAPAIAGAKLLYVPVILSGANPDG